ncbi:MAG: YwaF family protein, partial [Clostridia bacterium]|nr:YwaF family protein [Clostridia bacterium]
MQLWSTEHVKTLLPALGVFLLISILLRLWLKEKPWQVRMIPIQVVAAILVLLEVGKQAVSFSRGYDLYHIPLHFCSLVLFTLPAFAFYRGKYFRQVASIAVGFTAAVFVLTAIYPCLIYGSWNITGYFSDYMDFHTVTFHNLVMFAFMLIVALDVYTPGKGDWKSPVVFIGIYCIIAAVVSHLLHTNYNNLYQCNIPPLETVRLAMHGMSGYAPTQVIYVIVVTCLDMAFTLGAYHFFRL